MKGKAVPVGDLKLPKTLYKHRAYNNPYHLSALFEGTIYLPSANEFNDPQDCRIPFRFKQDELTVENIFLKCLDVAGHELPNGSQEEIHALAFKIQRENSFDDTAHLDKFDDYYYKKVCNDFGLFCLTPIDDNFLMWSYYGDSHRGFSIGYNTQKLVESHIFSMGGMVNYKKNFPEIPLFRGPEYHFFTDALFCKAKYWKHEKEYRLLHLFKNGKIQNLPLDTIDEVILGCLFSNEEAFKFIQQLRDKLPHVRISQMLVKKDGFGLEKSVIYDESLLIKTGIFTLFD